MPLALTAQNLELITGEKPTSGFDTSDHTRSAPPRPLRPSAKLRMIPANPRANRHMTMAQLKLRRLEEHNKRLKDDLNRPRAKVSEAGQALIDYCNEKRDPMLPSIWGPAGKNADPYEPQQAGGCCLVM